MNINMLTDADNDAGFYAAANGGSLSNGGASWRGATLLRSSDSGATYAAIAAFDTPASMGTTMNALGNFLGGNIPDELSSLTVRMVFGEPVSVSYASFLNGAQAAVVGDEILYYREAALNTDGTYTLRGLLRGRRGSEYAMTQHVSGERFVMLSARAMKRIADVSASIGVEQRYKAVTNGATLAATSAQAFTNVGAGLKPYAPVQLGGGRNAVGDLTLSWLRRGRLSGEWRDAVDVPLGEASEVYDVEIWQTWGGSRTTLKRTFSGLTSQSATYTASQQIADFGSAQAVVYFSVYQLSAIVGRGYEARGTI